MEVKLTTLTLLICLLGLSEGAQRGSIRMGDLTEGYPIHFEIHDKIGIPGMKRDEDIEVKAVGEEEITSVHIADLAGNGESSVTGGGVGANYVKIHLAGARGEPYRFLVEVRAEKF
ncbi:unnamed protein product, partial [Iphiclides podalirius]